MFGAGGRGGSTNYVSRHFSCFHLCRWHRSCLNNVMSLGGATFVVRGHETRFIWTTSSESTSSCFPFPIPPGIRSLKSPTNNADVSRRAEFSQWRHLPWRRFFCRVLSPPLPAIWPSVVGRSATPLCASVGGGRTPVASVRLRGTDGDLARE